jgi:hypothetical protein
MWFERFNIVVSSLAHNFDPATWWYYMPTWIEWGVLVGSFGWFGFWFLLFLQDPAGHRHHRDQGDGGAAREGRPGGQVSSAGVAGGGIRIKGVYAHLDCLLTGIERLKHEGLTGFEVLSPLPRHEILDAVFEGRPSPVRWWTLTGGVTGINTGFLLASLTAIAVADDQPGRQARRVAAALHGHHV